MDTPEGQVDEENPFVSPVVIQPDAEPPSRIQKIYRRQLVLLWGLLIGAVSLASPSVIGLVIAFPFLTAEFRSQLASVVVMGLVIVAPLGVCIYIVSNRARNAE